MKNNISGLFWAYYRGVPSGIAREGSHATMYESPKPAKVNIAPAVIYALDAFVKMCSDGTGCIGLDDGHVYVEVPTKTATTIVKYDVATGDVSAVDRSSTGVLSDISIAKTGHTGKAFILALFPILLKDREFNLWCTTYKDEISDKREGNELLQQAAQVLSSHVYYRLRTESTNEGFIPLNLPGTGNVEPLDDDEIRSIVLKEVLYGSPKILGIAEGAVTKDEGAKKAKPSGMAPSPILYYPKRELTEYEKALVPVLPSYYIETDELRQVVDVIDKTTPDAEPMRNFMFRGPSGTGKSVGAQYVAKRLNRPFVSITCSANTEMVDLLSSFMPNTSEDLPDISFGDIQFDPEGSWEKLTGEVRDSVEPEEVFDYLMGHRDNGKDFRLIESDFVKAIREGWVVEIQEAAAVTQPAVLTGLNKILNMAEMKTNGLLLADGSRLTRHPDSVVIFTTNVDYEGCRQMNQSVLDRMNLIYDMELPDNETLFQRTKEKTGYGKNTSEERTLKKMIEVIRMISDYLSNMGIVGTCGPRALNDWVRSTQITGNAYKSGILAVVNKAASDPEDQEALISSCLATQFRP